MAAASSSSSSLSSVRSWRTAFLTLRDETLNPPPCTAVIHLLNHLIFSHSETLMAVAPDLPSHEVTSDLMFLMELARTAADSAGDDDMTHTFAQLSHLIYNVIHHVTLDINSSYWALMIDSFGRMVEIVLDKAGRMRVLLGNVVARAIQQSLETMRCLVSVYQRKCSLAENTQLLNFLLSIVAYSHAELFRSSSSSGNRRCTAEFGKRIPRDNSLWEVQTATFIMIGEIFSRVGSSLPVDIWQSTIQVLKKVMDVLASENFLVEDNFMARFYTSLLHCLHLVLMDPKGSLSDHVAGFVAALRMFFMYGITDRSQLVYPLAGHKKEISYTSLKLNLGENSKSESGPYRPPHLRKQELTNPQQLKARESPNFSDPEFSTSDYTSSNSNFSDNDRPAKEEDNICCSKARVAAIVCIQDLCRADPKLFTAQWTMLLPSSDVLQPRKYEATLMTCLLFDLYLKARIASASTLMAMLDGPPSVFLQVAEYKESTKCGSFTALSSSLGQILMQLHIGILYLIQHETHSGLLASLFKILMLLISSTPYSRMPGDLLATLISSLRARIGEGFLLRSDQTSLLAVAINCLTAALSASPSSPKVKDLFVAELYRGFVEVQENSGVISTIFRYSQPVNNPTISLEALQALRAVSHNYPDIIILCWAQVSSTIHEILRLASPEVPTRPGKGNLGNVTGSIGEKVITGAVKVLDECLRAVSGFKGTEDLFNDKLFDTPFTSDYSRIKKISSAPSYGSENLAVTRDEPEACRSGTEQWSEAIEKHMPLVLSHTSAMVRAALVTCFAGITSSVFSSLPKEKQDFVLTSSINAALNDEVPSVRSAACRAIGVITCFPQIAQSAEILGKFIHAAEVNTRDSLVLVRITASWALANICDSLRHYTNAVTSKSCSIDSRVISRLIALLIECALRLTEDGDKIKANAVRALGNLSRFVQFTSQSGVSYDPADVIGLSIITNGDEKFPARSDLEDDHKGKLSLNSFQAALLKDSHWLERMVQAFLSCVATGNVKVQWNVCHALSNLFLNETLKLGDMDWAPSVFNILLLLLHDSPNFKIRIQAAAALAVPATILDYGGSFSDVIQAVVHAVENLSSDQITPSSFRYKIALEKQLTSTMLHVLSLAASAGHQPLKDFLVKVKMAKEYSGSPKPHQLESKRKRLTWILAVSGLCILSYILGARQSTSPTPATQSEVYTRVGCEEGSRAAAGDGGDGSSSASSMDFGSHHQLVVNSSEGSQQFPACDLSYGEYTPCQDPNRGRKFDRNMLKYRERHCPAKEELLRCLIPAPPMYKTPFKWPQSRDYAWYDNIPHKELSIEKAVQNWIQVEGDRFRFPGGGTMFPRGADAYIDDIAELIPLTSGNIRTAIDTGCGVASWGAYLLRRDIIAMSFAPRDTHEAQVWFALERGVPAMIGIMASKRLPYPARAFDMAHCSRCLIPWNKYDGMYLTEVDRVLRPGGYWILSGPPIRWKNYWRGWERTQEDLKQEQDAIEDLAKRLCWKKVIEKGDLSVWQKPINHIKCVQSRKIYHTPHICKSDNADAAWNKGMEKCITPLPEVGSSDEVAGGALEKWPERAFAIPPRVNSGSIAGITQEKFREDNDLWKERVTHYKRIISALPQGQYRNVMDMNANLGGFAAALLKYSVWVMNVVPSSSDQNTLGLIYERGFIGTYHDWCEAFSTYPRTYDLIHAGGVFSIYQDRCDITYILLEMDRILRPEGTVVFRDVVEVLVKIKGITDGMRWKSQIMDHESGPFNPEKILVAIKSYWTGEAKQEQD